MLILNSFAVQKSSETVVKLLNSNQIALANQGGNHLIRSRAKAFDSRLDESGLSIKWAVRGEEYYQIGDREYRVSAGQFIVVNPGQPIHFYGKSDDYIEGVCIYLDPEVISEVYTARGKTLDQQLGLGNEVSAYPILLNEMVWGLEDNFIGHWLSTLTEEDLDNTDEEFFYGVAEMLLFSEWLECKKANQIDAAKTHTKIELYRRLSTAANYIRENFNQQLSLDELARIACLSKYHLVRTFHQVYGKSPMQLLYDCRLSYAKSLLQRNPELDLRSIALSSGFPSRRSLTRKLGDWGK